MGLFAGLSMVTSSLVQSVWQLYITYSVLLALGTGALFSIVSSTTARWFVKKRGFAVGITSSSTAAGQIIMIPVATLLIDHFDWRWAFAILGIIIWLILVPVSLLMKRDPVDIGLLPDGVKPEKNLDRIQHNTNHHQLAGLRFSEAIKTREFWFLAALWLLLAVSVGMVMTHTVPHALDLGITAMNAAFIISLIGIGGSVGRLGTGKLSDSVGRRIPTLLCVIMQVGSLVWLIWIKDLWMFYVFAVIFGFSYGGLSAEIAVIVSDIFGVRSLGLIMGAITSSWGLGNAIGPAIGGIVYDSTGTYSIAFAVAAFGMGIGILLALLIHIRPLQTKVMLESTGR